MTNSRSNFPRMSVIRFVLIQIESIEQVYRHSRFHHSRSNETARLVAWSGLMFVLDKELDLFKDTHQAFIQKKSIQTKSKNGIRSHLLKTDVVHLVFLPKIKEVFSFFASGDFFSFVCLLLGPTSTTRKSP